MYFVIIFFSFISFFSAQAMLVPAGAPMIAGGTIAIPVMKGEGLVAGTRGHIANKNLLLARIHECRFGQAIRDGDLEKVKNTFDGWLNWLLFDAKKEEQCIVAGVLYAAEMKAEQAGKIVDYFVDKITADAGTAAMLAAQVNSTTFETACANCHKRFLYLLIQKFPDQAQEWTVHAAAFPCHTRILDSIRSFLPRYRNIDQEIVALLNRYKIDEQLIAALMPMAQLPAIGSRIDIKKLDEKRSLPDHTLAREVDLMLKAINDVLGNFLTKRIAKGLLTQYLARGLEHQEINAEKQEL